MSKLCPQCGNLFHSKQKEQVFCSNKCRGASAVLPRNICLHCGEPTPQAGFKYCDRDCYDRYRAGVIKNRIENKKPCPQCGEPVPDVNGRFCSHTCKVAFKKAKSKPCINCGTVFTAIKFHKAHGGFIGHNAGKTCSHKCQIEWIQRNPKRKEKISAAFTGENHPNWQGGRSAINLIVHRGSGWQLLAEKVRNRDKRVCKLCGKTEEENGRKMDVHHIKPYHDVNDTKKANRMSNLISLCKSCHRKEEHKLSQQQFPLPFAKIAVEERRRARLIPPPP